MIGTNDIVNHLHDIEREHNVLILYAAESGSRAWGFESLDSDYDPRFLFVRRKEDYLTLRYVRDTLDINDNNVVDGDIDASGWDVKKALILLQGQNAALTEWLRSPTVYLDRMQIANKMGKLGKAYFSPRRALYHYEHLGRNNYYRYIQGREQVPAKKYLYVLRSLLACFYVREHRSAPPVRFSELDLAVPIHDLSPFITDLLVAKARGTEKSLVNTNSMVDAWIEDRFKYFQQEADTAPVTPLPPISELDAIFQEAVAETEHTWWYN